MAEIRLASFALHRLRGIICARVIAISLVKSVHYVPKAASMRMLFVARGGSGLLPDTTAPESGIWHESLRSNKLKSEMCVMVSVLESRLTSKITFL